MFVITTVESTIRDHRRYSTDTKPYPSFPDPSGISPLPKKYPSELCWVPPILFIHLLDLYDITI